LTRYYNLRYINHVGLTIVKLKISNPSDKTKSRTVEFLVDSGALYSFVNKNILRDVGIKPEAVKEFVMANGEFVKRKIGIARYHYKRTTGGAPVVFAEPGDTNLLGATTLESLGLMLNPFKREIIPLSLTM